MATCGHCKQPGQTVQHVRTCGTSAVATLPQLPELAPGNVVTIDLDDDYWLVEAVLVGDQFQGTRPARGDGRSVTWPLRQVEMVFPNISAATDYRINLAAEETKRRNRETLHGDADYCRGCAKGWAGAKWHRTDCPRVQAIVDAARAEGQPVENNHHASGASLRESDPWAPVNELRNAVKAHLRYESKQGSHKRMGHFAIEADGTLKFLVIKELLSGKWAGRVFVDSLGSSTAYPVKAPATLTAYLTAVLADPETAAKRYADEMGQCSDCNRPLTNEESRARGIGPECWTKR